jgi:hypothetical protein
MPITWYWLVFLLAVGLVWLAWVWRPYQHPQNRTALAAATVQRLCPEGTRPRTPDDCPVCRQQTALPTPNAPTPTPVTPWSEVKSRRGAPKHIDTHGFACPNRTFQNLHLAHLLVDELRTRLRSRAHTLWLWVVVDPINKLIPVLHHPEGTRRAHPGCRPHRRPRSPEAAGARLHSGVHQRRLESVLLCADGPLRAVDHGRGAAGPPVAPRSRAAVWAGQEALSTAEARACDPSAALWNARSIEGRTHIDDSAAPLVMSRGRLCVLLMTVSPRSSYAVQLSYAFMLLGLL